MQLTVRKRVGRKGLGDGVIHTKGVLSERASLAGFGLTAIAAGLPPMTAASDGSRIYSSQSMGRRDMK